MKIKYLDKNITKLEKLPQGDLIDLRASRIYINGEQKAFPCSYDAGDVVFIQLGFAAKLPKGYKANIYPRSSTFKNYGLILTNSVGQIDNSYCGNNDEWCAMFVALKPGTMNYNDRVLQFDISLVTTNNLTLEEVEELEGSNRGGYGSTGVI